MIPHRPLHILLIDPDPGATLATCAIVMRAAPDSVLTVELVVERASRSLVRLQPNVVIIDPSPDLPASMQVIAAAKAPPFEAQVIVLASAPTAGLRRQMQRLGVDQYLAKPSPLLVADLRRFLMGERHAL